MLKDENNIDFSKIKPYELTLFNTNIKNISDNDKNGVDPLVDDSIILRLLVARNFDYQ